jgi:ATP-binding cassette, subfamily F, member 3
LSSYDGGWADFVRVRDARAAPPSQPAAKRPVRAKRGPVEGVRGNREVPPKDAGASELERIEAEIAQRESVVADLERRLADDWNDVETLAAHRRARDELQKLLERWESAFERAQT